MRKRMSRREWFLTRKLANVERMLKRQEERAKEQAERAKQREAFRKVMSESRASFEKMMDEKHPGWRLRTPNGPRSSSRGRGGYSGSFAFLSQGDEVYEHNRKLNPDLYK